MPKSIECDNCRADANVCLCQDHYNQKLEEEYERGKKDGREEAEEEFREDDKN